MVKVLLFSLEPILSEGFRQVLRSDPSLELVATCADVSEAVLLAENGGADVMVLDLAGDVCMGRLMEIRRHAPECKLILWTMPVSLERAHQAREIGVRGILRRDLSAELTLRCIRKVGEGELWFERDLLNSLLEARSVRLSPRERQLVVLVSRGFSNKQVAGTLSIAEGTVKVYLSKLFRKLGIYDRFELALYGLRNVTDVASGMLDASGQSMMRRVCPQSVIVPKPDSNEDYADLLAIG